MPFDLSRIDPSRVTDEFMQEMRGRTREYVLVLLRAGPNYSNADAMTTIVEHGRRNHALRLDGVLPVVCPVTDDTDLCGIGIFDASSEDVRRIMDGDPGVQGGIFTYEVHPVRSFPGDALPG